MINLIFLVDKLKRKKVKKRKVKDKVNLFQKLMKKINKNKETKIINK